MSRVIIIKDFSRFGKQKDRIYKFNIHVYQSRSMKENVSFFFYKNHFTVPFSIL